MINSTPVTAFIAAYAGSSAVPHIEPRPNLFDAAVVAQSLRDAQVHLFLSHHDEAVHLLMQARHDLLSTNVSSLALSIREIEMALWYVRHDETTLAVEQLEAARTYLHG